jgi:hypothetical protein
MISFDEPIVIVPPERTLPNGVTMQPPAVTCRRLDFVLTDDSRNRKASAWVYFADKPITLWEGDEYDAAGDYTQAEAEARLLEKLGPDIKAGIEALFVR